MKRYCCLRTNPKEIIEITNYDHEANMITLMSVDTEWEVAYEYFVENFQIASKVYQKFVTFPLYRLPHLKIGDTVVGKEWNGMHTPSKVIGISFVNGEVTFSYDHRLPPESLELTVEFDKIKTEFELYVPFEEEYDYVE